MTNQQTINKTTEFVKETLANQESGHGWWHIFRVFTIAVRIAKEENANIFVVKLASLLHDIADYKFNNGNYSINEQTARDWLNKLAIDSKIIEQVCQIINEVSFKGASDQSKPSSLESKIVQDADRLDALGAIGIARCFSYGGHKGREIYIPGEKPKQYLNFDQYRKNTSCSINHFYEKLLILTDKMNTQAGKKMAQKRHRFILKYLEQFFAEWQADR